MIINWNKFPNLKYLKIKTNNLELNNLNNSIKKEIELYDF